MTATERFLIVNADDLGWSLGINRGVATTYEHGILTSASLMVQWPAATDAARYARSHPALGVGLHFDLSKWGHREDSWRPVYMIDSGRREAVEAEARAQLARFRSLLGRDPTHVDSHHHVHLEEPVRSVLVTIAAELGVPLRGANETIEYRGDFYGQTASGEPLPGAITEEALIGIVHSLRAGTTELACHPGEGTDSESTYNTERVKEVKALCGSAVRTAIREEEVILCSFAPRPGVSASNRESEAGLA